MRLHMAVRKALTFAIIYSIVKSGVNSQIVQAKALRMGYTDGIPYNNKETL